MGRAPRLLVLVQAGVLSGGVLSSSVIDEGGELTVGTDVAPNTADCTVSRRDAPLDQEGH